MIEGGGLASSPRTKWGPCPCRFQRVVDIAVEDEAEAMQMAKKLLSYFQGPCLTGNVMTSASSDFRCRKTGFASMTSARSLTPLQIKTLCLSFAPSLALA